MQIPNFDEFKKIQKENAPAPLNPDDLSPVQALAETVTSGTRSMILEYLRSYHQWLSEYLSDK